MNKLILAFSAGLLAIGAYKSVLAVEVSNLYMDDHALVHDQNGDGVDDCVVLTVVNIRPDVADSSDAQGARDHFAFEIYDGNGTIVDTSGDVINYLTGGVLKTPGQNFGTWYDHGLNTPIFLGNGEPVIPYTLKILEVIPGQITRPEKYSMTLTAQKFEEYRSAYCQSVTVFPKTVTGNGGGITSVTGIKTTIRPIRKKDVVRPRILGAPIKLTPPPAPKTTDQAPTTTPRTEQKPPRPRG